MSDRTPRENAYFFVDRDELIQRLEAAEARAAELQREVDSLKGRRDVEDEDR